MKSPFLFPTKPAPFAAQGRARCAVPDVAAGRQVMYSGRPACGEGQLRGWMSSKHAMTVAFVEDRAQVVSRPRRRRAERSSWAAPPALSESALSQAERMDFAQAFAVAPRRWLLEASLPLSIAAVGILIGYWLVQAAAF